MALVFNTQWMRVCSHTRIFRSRSLIKHERITEITFYAYEKRICKFLRLLLFVRINKRKREREREKKERLYTHFI